jgi:ribosomal protein S18 acetylase RimI-like enzyme
MITYQPATSAQYTEFLNLMFDHMADFVQITLNLLGISMDEFKSLVRTLGQVYSINQADKVAGYYWIEERAQELHLHGIVLKEEYQSKGIGSATIKMLEDQYKGQKDFIELGVHFSNKNALKLYRKLGFQIETTMEDLQFHIMRKQL